MASLALPITLAAWLALAALPLLVDEWRLALFGQLLTYGIAAMGLAFCWGKGGLLSFGHGLFFGIGAYLMALIGRGQVPGLPESPWLGLAAGAAGAGLAAALLAWSLFFRRVVRGPQFGIVTLAAAVIAERVCINWDYVGGFNGLFDIAPLSFEGVGIAADTLDPLTGYLVVFAFAALCFAALTAIERTPFGTVLRAVRANETRVASLGFSAGLVKTAAFALSGAVTGLAGALFAVQFAFVSPAVIGFAFSTELLIWVAVGGKEVLTAAMLGAVSVKYVESVLSESLGQFWLLVLGILFVLVVVAFPRGLLGWLALPLPRRFGRASAAELAAPMKNTG